MDIKFNSIYYITMQANKRQATRTATKSTQRNVSSNQKGILTAVVNAILPQPESQPIIAEAIPVVIPAPAVQVAAAPVTSIVDAPASNATQLVDPKKRVKAPKKTFRTYIKKVLKQISPQTLISSIAIYQLEQFLDTFLTQFADKCIELCRQYDTRTITGREIHATCKLFLAGELCQHAIAASTKACTIYDASESVRIRQEHKAGLLFPVERIKQYLRGKGTVSLRVTKGSGVCLAAISEYLTSEILQLASYACNDHRMRTIQSRHVFLSITNDEELAKLFTALNIVWLGGGVIPHINSEFIHKNPKRRKTKATGDASSVAGGVVKPHRFRPGTVALRQIKRLQKTNQLLIRKKPFSDGVRRIFSEIVGDHKIGLSGEFLLSLQHIIEHYLHTLIVSAVDITINAGRETIEESDLAIILKNVYKVNLPSHDENTPLSPIFSEAETGSLIHLCRRAGCVRIGSSVHDVLRYFIETLLRQFCDQLFILMTYRRRTNLKNDHLNMILPIITGKHFILLPKVPKKRIPECAVPK